MFCMVPFGYVHMNSSIITVFSTDQYQYHLTGVLFDLPWFQTMLIEAIAIMTVWYWKNIISPLS